MVHIFCKQSLGSVFYIFYAKVAVIWSDVILIVSDGEHAHNSVVQYITAGLNDCNRIPLCAPKSNQIAKNVSM